MQTLYRARMLHTEVLVLIMTLSVSSVITTTLLEPSSECWHVYNTTSGQISSPNFPKDYPDYVQCDYFIRPQMSNVSIIKLEATHFDLEGGYDQIEIRETGPDGRFIGIFSGNVMPTLYAKAFWLRFVTDHSIAKSGFMLKWSVGTDGIRLVNGSNHMEGRVEIFYNSTWGTICDDAWGKTDAKVVCLMLGLPDLQWLAFAFATYGRGTGQIWLDNVGCFGNETTLLSCSSIELGKHNCNHGEDAGVRCTESYEKVNRMQRKKQSFPKGCGGYYNDLEGQITSPQFPLYPNFAHCEYYIYPPVSTTNVTRLTFQTFGLEKGADFLEIREDGANGVVLGRFTGDHLPPVFFAKRLYLLFTSDNSRTYRGFQAEWSSTDTGVRLRNGTWFGEGRFEMFYNKNWGTVCDDSWGNEEATVVCSMLGYVGFGAMGLQGGRYGRGTGPIFIDNVGCLGNENNILDCSHGGLYQHNCNHGEDAGVICGKSTMDSGDSTPNKMDNATIASLLEAVNISCGSMKLVVSVDMVLLNSLFPFLDQYNQYLSLAADVEECRGDTLNNGPQLLFQIDVTDCGMIISETEDSVLFHNKLVSHTNSSVQTETFRTGQTLAVPLECSLSKTVVLANRLKSFETRVEGETIKGNGNFSATMDFYKDSAFASMIYDYPAYVQLGQELGVEIALLTSLMDLKLVTQNCWATSTSDSPDHSIETAGYFLIQNRCPADPTTKYIQADSQNKLRFLFKTFEYIRKQSEVYIVCNLLVCNKTDQSARCTTDCDTGNRQSRSVDQSASDLQVVQGPLVFKDQSAGAKKKIPLPIILGVVIAVVVVVMVIITVMVVRSRKLSGDFSPPYSEYETKYEKVAMLDFD
ncbi:deleted in malignant brain tumors 1 protein-like [Gigantopelta aegis]|uniref:deleted in malignant brain tumors 1 protein-like n=1 Tax=Gigantopelta aegis TaxID=1735272 RepID=UPI001B889291|nr:deleted in malignant brain tumors 1 protein-like [Gigantopelta aegis]